MRFYLPIGVNDTMEMLTGSAAFLFELRDTTLTVMMRAFGNPEKIRKALSAACSHRHSIIITHGPEYIANAIAQLGKIALDNVAVYCGRKPFEKYRRESMWNYQLTLEGQNSIAHIRYHSLGKDETFCPLFEFLRVRYRRPYEWTAARKRSKGGRPRENWLHNDMWRKIENLSPAVRARYERLAKARAAKARKRAEEQQQMTKMQTNGKALSLKHSAKRIVRVDFSQIQDGIDIASLSSRDWEELTNGYDYETERAAMIDRIDPQQKGRTLRPLAYYSFSSSTSPNSRNSTNAASK